MIQVGSVWMKRHDKFNTEGGQLVIVEHISGNEIHYRFTAANPVHNSTSRLKTDFLYRMELVKE